MLDRADRIDRGRTLVAPLLAAKLFDGVSDRVDADPTLLDPRLAAAIQRTSFTSSRHPLEAERRHALAVLAGVPFAGESALEMTPDAPLRPARFLPRARPHLWSAAASAARPTPLTPSPVLSGVASPPNPYDDVF